MTLYILGFLIILFSFLAYHQTIRKNFLIFNFLAIVFIAISFYLNNGYIGVFAESLMLIVHLIALFTGEDKQKTATLFVAPITFATLIILQQYNLHQSWLDVFMPLAMFFFTIGVYQTNMANNKIFFILGLLLLSIYSYSIGDYFVSAANLLGIGVNVISLSQIISTRRKYSV